MHTILYYSDHISLLKIDTKIRRKNASANS